MEGKILGNRYELIERIGGGGMALVYKAKCRMLNRYVAVKILRPEFTNDEEFVKRFRVEAQSAASLSHPNIVSIYDVGQEESIHYIIMEYIDGTTLKEYIAHKGSLGWKEAVNIAIQVCSAIEHAHRNHIVHRDIKPQNILLTKDGIAKVTDFGIARAVSSSTITMVGSTIGSVHYFSPEQARGGYIDEKSDLYSLGIALYEMVTGRLPFNGDTPVAVALKHIQVEAEPPVEINSNVPSALNDVIMKAIKKELNLRYQTAAGMLDDLYMGLKDPYGSFVTFNDSDDYPTKKIPIIGKENIVSKDGLEMKGKKDTKKKREKLTVWLAVATSLVIIIILGIVAVSSIPSILSGSKGSVVEIQNYEGKNYDEVKAELTEKGITPTCKRQYDDEVAKDIIISQNIPAGQTLKSGGYNPIEFIVSDGPNLVKMPDLRNEDYRTALESIKGMGLVAEGEQEFSDTIANGYVTRTDPEVDTEVKTGSTVKIFYSKGQEIKVAKVPDLTGKTLDEAVALLESSNLRIGSIYPSDSVDSTVAITCQNPLPNTDINEGNPVDLYFDNYRDSQNLKQTLQRLDLADPNKFGDMIRVRVQITPSDTNVAQNKMDEQVGKSNFPLYISVPVPDNGETRVSVYLNDELIEFTKQ